MEAHKVILAGQSEERLELVGERSMLRREWLWKKSLLSRLSKGFFIVICSDQLLGAGKRGGMFKVDINWFFVLTFALCLREIHGGAFLPFI